MSGGTLSEQERADELSEAIDQLMAGQRPNSDDPLLDVARQLASVQYKPSRAAQARFSRQVEDWFALGQRKPRLTLLQIALTAGAVAIVLFVAIYSGIRNQVSAPQPTLIPLPTSTATATSTRTETPTVTPTITESATPTATLTPTRRSVTRVPATIVPTDPHIAPPPPQSTVDGTNHDGSNDNSPTDDHHGPGGNSGSSGGPDDNGSGQ